MISENARCVGYPLFVDSQIKVINEDLKMNLPKQTISILPDPQIDCFIENLRP